MTAGIIKLVKECVSDIAAAKYILVGLLIIFMLSCWLGYRIYTPLLRHMATHFEEYKSKGIDMNWIAYFDKNRSPRQPRDDFSDPFLAKKMTSLILHNTQTSAIKLYCGATVIFPPLYF